MHLAIVVRALETPVCHDEVRCLSWFSVVLKLVAQPFYKRRVFVCKFLQLNVGACLLAQQA